MRAVNVMSNLNPSLPFAKPRVTSEIKSRCKANKTRIFERMNNEDPVNFSFDIA